MHSFSGRVEPFFPLKPRIFRHLGRNFEKFRIFFIFCIYICMCLCNVFPRNMRLRFAHPPEFHTRTTSLSRENGRETWDAKDGMFSFFCLCVMASLALPRPMVEGSDQSRSTLTGHIFSPRAAELPVTPIATLPPVLPQ